MTEEERAYCPCCDGFLADVDDESGVCWGVCALAGLRQPAIHRTTVEVDTFECRDGLGLMVRTYQLVRRVPPRNPSAAERH